MLKAAILKGSLGMSIDYSSGQPAPGNNTERDKSTDFQILQIGANIIDLSLILPVSALASGKALPVAAQSVAVDLPACLLITLMAIVPLMLREKSSKLQGAVLLAAYAVYLIIVI